MWNLVLLCELVINLETVQQQGDITHPTKSRGFFIDVLNNTLFLVPKPQAGLPLCIHRGSVEINL